MKTYHYRKPHSYKRRKSILKNRFLWLGILVFLFLFGSAYFLFFSDFFIIEKVIVSGEQKVQQEAIKSSIPSKNIFLIDIKTIRAEILDNFPQIAEVEIKRGFPDSLDVLVIKRFPLANWCQDELCFLLDNEGVIFEKIIEVQPRYVLIKGEEIVQRKLGEQVIEKDDLAHILDIETSLKSELEIPVKEIIVAKEKLIVRTIEGWEIYFNLEGDIDWQLTKLAAVLEEKIPQEKRKNLEYIELRFGNLAPYKYKD